MPSRFDEDAELRIRYRRSVDEEATDGYVVCWSLFGVMLIRSHAEGAPFDPYHLGSDGGCSSSTMAVHAIHEPCDFWRRQAEAILSVIYARLCGGA